MGLSATAGLVPVIEGGEGAAPQVRAGDFSHGVAVCHVDGPNPGTGADVDDALGVAEGGEVEFAVE